MNKEKNMVSKPLKPLLFIILCIGLNLCLSNLAGLFNLPLYLDNAGTIIAAAVGGYLPGIIVGYLTNIISMPFNPDNGYYAVLNAMIAVLSAYLSHKGFFRKPKRLFFGVFLYAFIGGIFGGLLTYLMSGFSIGEGITTSLSHTFMEKYSLSPLAALLSSSYLLDLVDKFITVYLAFLVVHFLPYKIKDELKFTSWRQTPLSDEAIATISRNETRMFSLRAKIIVIISVLMVFVAVITTTVSYLLYHNFSIKQFTSDGMSTARLAASTIDGDMVDTFIAEGDSNAEYKATEARLQKIRETSSCIEYIYAYKIEEDGCHVVFDLDTGELQGESAGTVIPFDESFDKYVPDLLAGKPVDPIITNDTYGWLLTDYEPVYDSQNRVVCYAAADIQMQDIVTNGVVFLTKSASLFLGFFILILAICVWLAKYHLLYTISAMTLAARKFAFDTEEARDVSVNRLLNLNIHTGDEIENLYESLSKTIADTVGYIEDVETKGRQISKMQNGLIYVMADLVESRDQNTGDHVRKTAAYVDLILRKLKEKGLHEDVLTPEYMEDVVHSAPLHDVGKIKISDTILNKPGRLTDEEFAIMKTHTTAGEEILNSAISLVSDSGYLVEAKNLATYHHERWDGKGYPTGKAGEDIPLSARIMAVADVFDALVSRRSYKKPFTFEESMNIIREGAGTQFDPEIANIFVESADEVMVILKRHEEMLK
ncbi:MAG: HD domain-containing protein [Lachnospiraceae bacterium]|nr:HD domain-containing protein [Lachnospiraceae bacterium]